MRDIGTRIQRYRLSRYGIPRVGLRGLRWFWPLLLLWLAYAGVLGEHSWFRIWRLGRENARTEAELAATRHELERKDQEMRDPRARRETGERALRERSGFARPGEIIYRIPSDAPPDSAGR